MNMRSLIYVLVLGLTAASPAFADPATDLITAIGSDKSADAAEAIAAGADVNADVGEGRTMLISAVMFSRPQIVRMLLDHGADPNRRARDTIVGNAVGAAFFAM